MTQRLNSNVMRLGETLEADERTWLLGQEEEFQHADYSSASPIVPIDARTVRARVVKNGHASSAMLPSQLVKWKTGTNEWERVTADVCSAGDAPAGVVDPWLPAAGVAAGKAYWLIIEGPVKGISSGLSTHAVGAALMTDNAGKFKARSAESVIDAFVGRCEEALAATDGLKGRINFARR